MAFERFCNFGLKEEFSASLTNICSEKNLNPDEIDQRAIEALCDLDEDVCRYVIDQYSKSDLYHVKNKSAYLCGVIRSSSQRFRRSPKLPTGRSSNYDRPSSKYVGPNEENIKKVAQKTGYSLEIVGSTRKYGGPPPGWQGKAPCDLVEEVSCRVSIFNLSSDIYEDTLVPLCEKYGEIFEMRISYDLNTNCSKGMATVTFCCQEETEEFSRSINGRYIGDKKAVIRSFKNNNKLSIFGLPRNRNPSEIQTELSKYVTNIKSVIRESEKNNINTWIVEFNSNHDAFVAKNILSYDDILLFSENYFDIDWYEVHTNIRTETSSKYNNKVVFVSGIKESTNDRYLWDLFGPIGSIHSIRKVRDFAFVEYVNSEDAAVAIEECNGKILDGCIIELNYARPPSSSGDRNKSDSSRNRFKHQRIEDDDRYDNYPPHYYDYNERDRYNYQKGYFSPNYYDDYYPPPPMEYHSSMSSRRSPSYSHSRNYSYDQGSRYDGYKKHNHSLHYYHGGDKYSGY